MSSHPRWIEKLAETSLDPFQVGRSLEAIAARWGGSLETFLDEFPLGAGAVIHLLAVAPICAQRLEHDPDLLRWLARPDVCAVDRGPRRMLAELHAFAKPS
ncbi:MAG: hypothetical protein ABI839_06700, partial [Verrucomicrobiota bacterium]